MTSTPYGTSSHRRRVDDVLKLQIHPVIIIMCIATCITALPTAKAHAQTTDAIHPGPANSTDAPAALSMSADTHLIVFTGFTSDDDKATFKQAIRSQLADINKEIIFESIDALTPEPITAGTQIPSLMSSHGAGTAFIVTPAEANVDLQIVRGTRDGFVTTKRPVAATHGSPQHEALAVIIRATILAIDDQQSLPADPAPAEKQKPKTNPIPPMPIAPTITRPPADNSRTGHLFVEAALALGYFSGDTTIWPGAALALGWSPFDQLVFHVDYILFAQIEKRTPELTLALTRHPIYLGVQLRKRRGNTFLGGGLAFSIDIISEEITPHAMHIQSDDNGPQTLPGLYGYLQFGMSISRRVHIFIRPGIEMPLRRANYSIRGIENETLIIRPLVVQPAFRAGFQFDFF